MNPASNSPARLLLTVVAWICIAGAAYPIAWGVSMIFLDPDKSALTGDYTVKERFDDMIRDFERDRDDHFARLYISLIGGAIFGVGYYLVRSRRDDSCVP